jgi:hypothetical protein
MFWGFLYFIGQNSKDEINLFYYQRKLADKRDFIFERHDKYERQVGDEIGKNANKRGQIGLVKKRADKKA